MAAVKIEEKKGRKNGSLAFSEFLVAQAKKKNSYNSVGQLK